MTDLELSWLTQLTLADATQICSAFALLWALAWGIRKVVDTLDIDEKEEP